MSACVCVCVCGSLCVCKYSLDMNKKHCWHFPRLIFMLGTTFKSKHSMLFVSPSSSPFSRQFHHVYVWLCRKEKGKTVNWNKLKSKKLKIFNKISLFMHTFFSPGIRKVQLLPVPLQTWFRHQKLFTLCEGMDTKLFSSCLVVLKPIRLRFRFLFPFGGTTISSAVL